MSTFESLAQQNPNIRDQYDEWREIRSDRNEDAASWLDFRQHVIALGAPDPGEQQPTDWVGPDYHEGAQGR